MASSSRAGLYGFKPDMTGVTTLSEFLAASELGRLGETLAERGITEIGHLTVDVVQDICGQQPAVRPKLMMALDALRSSGQLPVWNSAAAASSSHDAEPTPMDQTASTAGEAPVAPASSRRRQLPNSTSSLYIFSTTTNPDMYHLCFCVSLVVHDLVADSEAKKRASTVDHSVADDPLGVFLPVREIFTLAGKRRRSEYEQGSPGGTSTSFKSMVSDESFKSDNGSGGEVQFAARDLMPPPGASPPGPPPPTTSTGPPLAAEVPSEEDIRDSIADVHALARFTPGVLVVALIYIERLRRTTGALLLASTWQPILLIALIIAQKVWEDRSHLNVDFTLLCPTLNLKQLNALERNFLRLIDYNVGVKATVYTEWYFHLCALCERNSMRMRPLDGQEAKALEISASRFAERQQTAQTESPRRPNSFPEMKLPTEWDSPDVADADSGLPSSHQRTRAVIS